MSSIVSLPAANPASERFALRTIWQRGLVGGALAAIANAVIFSIVVDGFGVSDAALDRVQPTIVLSLLGALGATAVFALMLRSARHPIRTFRIVSLAVLIVSFVPDFFFSGATTAWGIPTLLAMHVVAAAIIVGILTGEFTDVHLPNVAHEDAA